MKDMAELPTEDGAAGQRQANGIGPEGEGPLLMVSAQNDALEGQGQVRDTDRSVGSYCAESPCHWALAPSAVPGHNNWRSWVMLPQPSTPWVS